MNNDMPKELKTVMKVMCSVVKAPFTKMNFKKSGWFRSYSWTEEQREDFKGWLIHHLYTSKEAREYFMEFPIKNKTKIKMVVEWFLLDFGWMTKKENKNGK
jgi:hypothetical protein